MKSFIIVWGIVMSVCGLYSMGWADEGSDVVELKKKVEKQETIIQQQDKTIQQLLKRMEQLEAKIEGEPSVSTESVGRVSLEEEELPSLLSEADTQEGKNFPIIEFGGYVDLGYVDAEKSGATASSSRQINSRADSTASAGLTGDASFLVNEVNLDITAHVSQSTDAILSFDFLPREFGFTTSGGTASTDSVEVDLAYVVFAPSLEPSSLSDALFGDLRISLGKFESPMGIEYRYNESPDRVNISRSHQSIYTTGYPVGIRARGNLFQNKLREFRNSVLTYNIILANADPFLERSGFGDINDNDSKTIMGRLSYGLDTLGGFFEMGTSLLHGARLGQPLNDVTTDSIDSDLRFERGPLTLRAEWDYANKDRPPGGSAIIFHGIYVEGFYVFKRPEWLPGHIPMVSLTPYYRYDTRDFETFPVTGSGAKIDVERHTFALRYIPSPGNILKTEYQLNLEKDSKGINDNLFLMSFIREF